MSSSDVEAPGGNKGMPLPSSQCLTLGSAQDAAPHQPLDLMASSGFRSNRGPNLANAGQGAQALNLRRDRQQDDEHEDGPEDHPLGLVRHGRRRGRRLGGLLSPLFSLTRWLWRVDDDRK